GREPGERPGAPAAAGTAAPRTLVRERPGGTGTLSGCPYVAQYTSDGLGQRLFERCIEWRAFRDTFPAQNTNRRGIGKQRESGKTNRFCGAGDWENRQGRPPGRHCARVACL